jgi:hypothetical protein
VAQAPSRWRSSVHTQLIYSGAEFVHVAVSKASGLQG